MMEQRSEALEQAPQSDFSQTVRTICNDFYLKEHKIPDQNEEARETAGLLQLEKRDEKELAERIANVVTDSLMRDDSAYDISAAGVINRNNLRKERIALALKALSEGCVAGKHAVGFLHGITEGTLNDFIAARLQTRLAHNPSASVGVLAGATHEQVTGITKGE